MHPHGIKTCFCWGDYKYRPLLKLMDFSITQSLKWMCLTLSPLTWKIWWAPNNASRWQMGFNSAFKRLNHFALLSSLSQATDFGAYVSNTAFPAVSKQVPLHYLSYAPADNLSQHQSKLYVQWGMLQRTMLQRRNATTNIFTKKIRMLQLTRRNTIGRRSTSVRMTCRTFPLWLERVIVFFIVSKIQLSV